MLDLSIPKHIQQYATNLMFRRPQETETVIYQLLDAQSVYSRHSHTWGTIELLTRNILGVEATDNTADASLFSANIGNYKLALKTHSNTKTVSITHKDTGKLYTAVLFEQFYPRTLRTVKLITLMKALESLLALDEGDIANTHTHAIYKDEDAYYLISLDGQVKTKYQDDTAAVATMVDIAKKDN